MTQTNDIRAKADEIKALADAIDAAAPTGASAGQMWGILDVAAGVLYRNRATESPYLYDDQARAEMYAGNFARDTGKDLRAVHVTFAI